MRQRNMAERQKIKCFECGKPGYITTNYFSKQKHMNKHVMKVDVIISDSTSTHEKDDTNFLAFFGVNYYHRSFDCYLKCSRFNY